MYKQTEIKQERKPSVLVVCRRKHGLEVYEVYVRGVYSCEFLSEHSALNKANALARSLAA